jgi:hypothetical protein
MLSTYDFQQWGYFYVPQLLRHGISIFKINLKDLWILTSKCRALAKELSLPILESLNWHGQSERGLNSLPPNHEARALPLSHRDLSNLSMQSYLDVWVICEYRIQNSTGYTLNCSIYSPWATNNSCPPPQGEFSRLWFSESLWKMLQDETCLHSGRRGFKEILGKIIRFYWKIAENWKNCIIKSS